MYRTELDTLEQLSVQIDALAEEIQRRYTQVAKVTAAGQDTQMIGRQEIRELLANLREAASCGEPVLFVDCAVWTRSVWESRHALALDGSGLIGATRSTLNHTLSEQDYRRVQPCLDAAIAVLSGAPSAVADAVLPAYPLAGVAKDYLAALLQGDRRSASGLILGAVDGGVPIADIYVDVFQRTQHEIGRLWQLNRISVAQEHFCTAATQLIMSQLYDRIFATPRNGRAMVATCVSGELHELGIRMIADLFELDGWDTYYLGANTPVEGIISSLKERGAQLLTVSATMTPHVRTAARMIEQVRCDAVTRDVKIMVGGYPFTLAPSLCKSMGADCTALDARMAIALARDLLSDDS